MTGLGAVLNSIENGQSFLESYIPEIPKDAVKGIVRSFTCSFAAGIVLSEGKFATGLTSGALAILATAIHIAFITAIDNLLTYFSYRSNKPKEPITVGCRHMVFLLSWVSIIELGITDNRASFLLTIPFILWNMTFGDATRTPVMGIVVV